nr:MULTISPECIES: cell envelope integrity protein TolA [unclassified Vibrio]
MLFEQAAFNPRHKVSLTVRLDKDAPYTSRVKPVNTNTILFKNEYDFFTEITEAKQLAIKTESWSGEDYWIFDVADLGKYSAKFDSICPEQGLIEAGAAQSTSLKEFYAVEKAKELEKEKQKQEQLEKERHEAEQARLKEDKMAQKAVAAEKEALTPERSHFIATEAERYGAIYEQQIKKNLLMEDSYKGKSCKLNLRLIPTGSNAILGGVSILDGDSRLCAATKRGVAQVSSYPLPSDKDVASELKSVDLNIVVE